MLKLDTRMDSRDEEEDQECGFHAITRAVQKTLRPGMSVDSSSNASVKSAHGNLLRSLLWYRAQEDGNLALYDTNHVPIWASNTCGQPTGSFFIGSLPSRLAPNRLRMWGIASI
jgi:hypothetical protein